MATKNTRNARMLISATLSGTYEVVNKTHGLNLNLPTDFSEDTAHGQRFKSYIPGLQDFQAEVTSWYDSAYSTLEAASLNKLSYYFLIYPDYADVQNYYRGQCYFGLDGLDLSIGNTADLSFTVVIFDGDVDIIRGGTSILA